MSDREYIERFLKENNIFELDKDKQIIETAKLVGELPW